jgi:hypothetical protein
MRMVSRMLVASVICIVVSPASATPDQEVRGIISTWVQAYTDGDHNKISQLYDRFARLHGVDTADMIGPESVSQYYYFDKWHNKLRSVRLADYKCHLYDDATASCAGAMELVLTKRSGETLSEPSRFSMAFAYDHHAHKWLIHDHQVQRGIAVAVSPAATLQADAVELSPVIVPASASTIPVK